MRRRETITIEKDRETIFREALAREKAVRLRREDEATIITPLEELFVPPPRLTGFEKEFLFLKIMKTIKKEAINILRP